MIDEELNLPFKCEGPVELYNGIDVQQMKYSIKLSCKTYIDRICEKYLLSWMKDAKIARYICLLPPPDLVKEFITTASDTDDKQQEYKHINWSIK